VVSHNEFPEKPGVVEKPGTDHSSMDTLVESQRPSSSGTLGYSLLYCLLIMFSEQKDLYPWFGGRVSGLRDWWWNTPCPSCAVLSLPLCIRAPG